MDNILQIRNLSVEYYRNALVIPALRGVTLSVEEGQTVALVGESGCGKSTLALSAMGLIYSGDGRITSGEIVFSGKNILENSFDDWRKIRGGSISIVFQDPFSSLNPLLTIEEQLIEAIDAHKPGLGGAEKLTAAAAALDEVSLQGRDRILKSYPHQLSGGQRQRAAIAMAIINRPKILIADEPTTALDVTIQKEILDLIDNLKKELSLTVILITHNLPLAYERSKKTVVMYAGEIVETGETADLFKNPLHPYTKALIQSVPRLYRPDEKRFVLAGQPPAMYNLPRGCKFAPRCPGAMSECSEHTPPEYSGASSMVKCFIYKNRNI